MSEDSKDSQRIKFWQKQTFKLLPEMRAAKAAGLFPKKDGWRNVVEHELVESEACDVLAETLNLPQSERSQLKKAAALHDVFKRKEKQLMEKYGPEGYDIGQDTEGVFLKERGYDDEIIRLVRSVGHGSLLEMVEDPSAFEIKIKDDIDLPTLIIHYVDDITLNNDLVPLNNRIDYLEANPRYEETNKEGRKVFGGRTYFEVQREVSRQIEAKFAKILGVNPPENLPDWVKGKILERIEQYKLEQISTEAANAAFRVIADLGDRGKIEKATNAFGERTLIADWEAEEAVINVFKKHDVPIKIISEEHGEIVIGENPRYLAVLDGLDGTFQYKRDKADEDRRFGTMFAIFESTNPAYEDGIVSFIMEHPTRRLFFASKGKGAFVFQDNQKIPISVSGEGNLDNNLRLFVDEGLEYNKLTFSSKLSAYKPRCTIASSRYYADLINGDADVVCECTRKRNLEIASAYLLVKEAGGVMISLDDGQDIGQKHYIDFGQGKNEYKGVISAGSAKLAAKIREKVSDIY